MKMGRITAIIFLLITFGSFTAISQQDVHKTKAKYASDTAEVNRLIKLSADFSSSDLDLADSLASRALQLLNQLDYTEGLIKCLNRLSFIRSSKGNFDDGYQLNEKALQLSKELGNKELLAESYNHLFMAHFKKSNYKEALEAALKAEDYAMEVNSKRMLGDALDNIGIIHGINGDHSTAIEYFMQSLSYFEALGDESEIAISLMHLGHTFELAGNYRKALEYLKKSLEVNQKIGNKFNEAWALVNIGVTYSRLNMIDTALQYYEQSLLLSEKIKDQRLILTNLDNIGGKYSLIKDFEKANYYLNKAYRLSEMSGLNSRTVYILGNLAENYLYMSKFDSARFFGERQLELALNSGLISEQKVAYYVLAQVYDSLKDYRSANRALQGYISVNDTIFNREKSLQVEELRESYEAERKEQTIANLENEKRAERFRRNTFAGTALIILIIGSLLVNNQRVKIRKNRELLKKEKEVDELKSRFFANITHEFRTPLTLILGPIELMKSEAVNPKIHQHLDIMKTNALRLLDLINQLLELSKLESGTLKLKAAYGNIVPVIKGIMMSFQSIAITREINLSVTSSEETIYLYFDREKIEKVLINIFSNAVKYTPDKGHVHVEVIKMDEILKILVRDDGKGIPSDELNFVFNRFYQSKYSDKSTGTGIGLALAKELIELHHGTIKADNSEDGGTEFHIELPLLDTYYSDDERISTEKLVQSVPDVREEKENQEVGAVFTERDAVEEETSQKPVLLLIEDSMDVMKYIIEILGSKYRVIQANDGMEGVELALEHMPDLIISDVMMPRKNGYEVCETLKQNEITNHIPIILLTAKVTTEDKIQGLENQADDYLTKPFIPKELLIRIQNLIDSRKKLREKYKRELILKPGDIVVDTADERFIKRLLHIMEDHISDEKFGVEQLAAEAGMSRSQIHRKMISLANQPPNHFIKTFRLTRAMELLKKKVATASEIAYQVGFSSPSYFTKCFREAFGYPPGEVLLHS